MSLGSTSEIAELRNAFLIGSLITVRGHVEGRGLARKSSTHCVVFSGREKVPKG
jgi:hypothetical protein